MTGAASRLDVVTVLTNGTVTLQLEGPAATLEGLDDYFGPWFVPGEVPGGVRVRLHVGDPDLPLDDGNRTRTIERHRNENERRSWFANEHDVGGVRTLVLDTGSVVVPDNSGPAVDIWSPDETVLLWDAKDVVQRQVVQPSMLRTHSLMHAASVSLDGRSIAILGPRGAGKSTTQLQLARGGAQLLSADRCYVRPGPRGIELSGYPARSSVDPETFRLFPELDGGAERPRDGRKVLVSLADLAERLGTTTGPPGPLGCIVVPSRAGDGPLFEETDGSAVDIEWMDGADPIVRPWLGLFDVPEDAPDRRAEIREVVSRSVPAFRLNTDRALAEGAVATVRRLQDLLGSR